MSGPNAPAGSTVLPALPMRDGHTLLIDACRCIQQGQPCLTCRRWLRHYREVRQRRARRPGAR